MVEPKPKAAPKRKQISLDDSDEEKPKKKAAPKKKAEKKASQIV